jgi:hypothetical protein
MRVFIARSETLKAEALDEGLKLEEVGLEVALPVDPRGLTEEEIHVVNASRIKDSDEVFAIWNGVSDGCYGDVCMAIALGKPVYVRTVRGTYDISESRRWALFNELDTIENWWETYNKK